MLVNKWRSVRLLGLVAVLVLSVWLSACGNSSNTPNSNTPNSNTPNTQQEGQAGEGDGQAEAGSFIKNMSLKLVTMENPTTPLNPNTPVLREIERITGVKLDVEPVPSSNYEEKKRVLIGTNNMPDIMRVKQTDIADFARTGVFLNLSDYIDEHAPNFKKVMEQVPEYNRLLVDGKLYGFPLAKYNPQNIDLIKGPAIRLDVLEKLNLNVPKSFDDLYDVLKKIKTEYPGSYPFTVRALETSYDAIAYAFGTGKEIYFDHDVNGGAYKYGNVTEEFREMLAYLHKLYSEGLLDPDFAVNNNQRWLERVGSEQSFFIYDNVIFTSGMNAALKSQDPDAIIQFIPFLANRAGQVRPFTYANDWPDESWAISSKISDPVAVVKLYDWLYSEEGMLTSNYGILGETYEMVDGQPIFLQSFLERIGVSDAGGITTLNSELGSGFPAYSSYVDRFGPEAQVWDDDYRELIELIRDNLTDIQHPRQIFVNPPFTAEEQDQIKRIQSQLQPVVMDGIIKFIMGTRPLSEFDNYAAELVQKGALDLEKLYNDALNRIAD